MDKENTSKTQSAPAPMLSEGNPVDWLFIYKFSSAEFPGTEPKPGETGIFGGTFQDYRGDKSHSQSYVFASSADETLQKGKGLIGTTLQDPLGATYNQVYNGTNNYVLWNDQFYGDPAIKGQGSEHGNFASPWGHSKGMITWNDAGEGFVMQVSTPSWPASGNIKFPRKTGGNTLGCISDDDNIEVAQHFFALKINKDDLVNILKGLANSSVGTDPTNEQVVKNGGPADVQALVSDLGKLSDSTTVLKSTLSSGVEFISKPSSLHVPPWQMVSSQLNSIPLRVASWWAKPKMVTTTASSVIGCWDASLGTPGPVEIAITGIWDGVPLNLVGDEVGNHAKLGISLDPKSPLSIFGDMNQQGALSLGAAYPHQKCSSSQNGRGGTFYALNNETFCKSLSAMIAGKTGPEVLPPSKDSSWGNESSWKEKY